MLTSQEELRTIYSRLGLAMRALRGIINARTVIAAVFIVLAVLAVDTGSVLLTQMSSHDDVKDAGYQAAAVAKKGPANQQTAVTALAAAETDAGAHGITIRKKSFLIYPDGSVRLTGVKAAPTLLMDHVGLFRHFTQVRTTLTVEPLPYDD